MSAQAFTQLFLFFLVLTVATRIWLTARQMRSVKKHSHAVPAQFAERIPLAAHKKAAAYTLTKSRFSLICLGIDTLVLLGLTLLGGMQFLVTQCAALASSEMTRQMMLVVAVCVIVSVADMPFDCYRQFVIEEKFGFNKMTFSVYLGDLAKNTLLSAVIGLPVLWVLLAVMHKSGSLWWLYAWVLWNALQYLMLFLYPTFIAPLFNKFSPLAAGELRTRIEHLMEKTGFHAKGLYIMDGSKRSAHGNAYFTGFGSAKRVVFFDTLIEKLSPGEVEAVLAHELGHFRLRHVIKRMLFSSILSLAFLALLGFLKTESWFYAGLGVDPSLASDALALVLFGITLPLFTFFFSPLLSMSSRKHEFEADAFSAANTNAHDLVSALVKMYEDNASTLTPDPIHSAFYDSHPPASIRINRLLGKP